jgi:carbon storage regulator
MLVLTRKIDESIMLGDSIVITVLAVEGEKVKIGIAAPRELPILRQEVYQAIQEQAKIQAALAEQAGAENFEQLRQLLADETEKEPTAPENHPATV